MFVKQTTLRPTLLTLVLIFLSVTMIAAQTFPDVISLPDGFRPEGIAVGKGSTFYVGSLANGAIYSGDLRTGEGDILVPGQEGRVAVGLKYDERTGLLFVAGGPTGFAYVYDGQTGENVAAIQLTTKNSFINDVVVTNDAAYFTNSFQPELYRVSLTNHAGAALASETISLSGDYQFDSAPGAFNANGIAATPNGQTLIIVNSSEGALYNVNPGTGEATRIDLGAPMPNGDGLLLEGKTLYVVQNFLNQIAVVELNSHFTSGVIVDTITNPQFDIPTTIARFGNALYAVNARFSTPPTPHTEYNVVRVPLH